jgi:transposase
MSPQLYVDGMSLRRIARYLGLHHRTVSLWIQSQAGQLPDLPVPSEVKEAEMDELFTLIGDNYEENQEQFKYPTSKTTFGY